MASTTLKDDKQHQGWMQEELVVAFDFGTTYSGYVYSFRSGYPGTIQGPMWQSGEGQATEKTPTCLLLNPDGSFHSFGYEAETKYAELVSEFDLQDEDEPKPDVAEYKQWHFFSRFKMNLYEAKEITDDLRIKDAEGRDFRAIKIFSLSINYLKDHALKAVHESKIKTILEEKICYVVTAPAIWSDTAKQFMREAAEMAGIKSDRLRIALEPECAAFHCNTIIAGNKTSSSSQLSEPTSSEAAFGALSLSQATSSDIGSCIKPLETGSCYMVVDMGGGTVDIVVHEMTSTGICEVHPPSGGPWGGDTINQNFSRFVKGLVGAKVYKNFHDTDRTGFLSLMRTFELKKCANVRHSITFSLPVSLTEEYVKEHRESFTASTKETPFSKTVRIKNSKMRIENSVFEGFQKTAIDPIVKHIHSVLQALNKPIDTMLLVGGFSNSALMKETIKQECPRIRLVNPTDASLSVLKGAIIYGRQPEAIRSRICRYTYGVDWNESFDPRIHPVSKREETKDGAFCRDVFKPLVYRGQVIPCDFTTETLETGVKFEGQDRIEFPFYRTDSLTPKFIDESNCHFIEKLVVELPKMRSSIDQSVYLRVAIGGTEIRAEAFDDSGKKHYVKFGISDLDRPL